MRRDIQILRGIAVLVVVLYHSNLGLLAQGYLGVDIFFVLSGFLITTIILKGLENNNFLFSEFYLRRAKRLLPALYSTLFFTTLLSLIVLTNHQWLEYLEQLKGALTFTANMVLPSQTGYFESASEGKPLLHIWSLSLEEQYYFLLPISLYFLPKKFRLITILFFTLISLVWCFSWVYSQNQNAPFLWRIADSSKSEWAFYLLFTRAWELLAGSICAWVMLNKSQVNTPKSLKFLALIFISIGCTININNEHPSIESVIIVLSPMVILIDNREWLPKSPIIRLIEKVGDWSYSIYLVHWPLFAFAYLSYAGDVPVNVKVTLIGLSLVLGYLQFRYVETPFREGRFKNQFSSWKATISATLALLAIPIAAAYSVSDTEDGFSHIRRVNHGLGKECDGSFDDNNRLKGACISGGTPKIVVWGDSYAMHLVPGLLIKNKGLTQITKSACGPIMGIAPNSARYGSIWAKKCLQFNANAMDYIDKHPSITHVVLSLKFSNYLEFKGLDYMTDQGAIDGSHEVFIIKFKNTVIALKQKGITPIIFSPLPKSGFDAGECLVRQLGPALLLRENCEIKYDKSEKHQEIANSILEDIEEISRVVWLKEYLCNDEICQIYVNNTFIYRDDEHLSIDGSIQLLKNMDITNL
ncbi:MAG: acyltransferase [Colwellia sp.]|nr:acyltransferase [Colwellia sp.]